MVMQLPGLLTALESGYICSWKPKRQGYFYDNPLVFGRNSRQRTQIIQETDLFQRPITNAIEQETILHTPCNGKLLGNIFLEAAKNLFRLGDSSTDKQREFIHQTVLDIQQQRHKLFFDQANLSAERSAQILTQAVRYAAKLHENQNHGPYHSPYNTHIFSVAGIVANQGGSLGTIVAALLHDLVEDTGDLKRLSEITWLFGEDIGRIVSGCSFEYVDPLFRIPRETYWVSKQRLMLRRLAENRDEHILLVKTADLIHNTESTLLSLKLHGQSYYQKFRLGKMGELWKCVSRLDILKEQNIPSDLLRRLERCVETLVKKSNESLKSVRRFDPLIQAKILVSRQTT
ncbi:MAG: HD domain-containing protein [Vampirovibrio sp.]|nr:HD domain-containing protein [Vampirovibrio sp.]